MEWDTWRGFKKEHTPGFWETTPDLVWEKVIVEGLLGVSLIWFLWGVGVPLTDVVVNRLLTTVKPCVKLCDQKDGSENLFLCENSLV